MSMTHERIVPPARPTCRRHPHGAQTAPGALARLFAAMGLLALVWFLVRVVPKPSRATYPCQRAALPLASGFVLWLLGAAGTIAAWRYAQALWRSRWGLATACAVAGVLLGLLALSQMPDGPLMASSTLGSASGGALQALVPNAPIGTPRGIHPGRVVWVHDPTATNWLGTNDAGGNIGDGYWYQSNHTNQAVVDRMFSETVRRLAGEATDAAAWNALFRFFNQNQGKGAVPYQAGEKISIKVNMVTVCRTLNPPVVDSSGNQTKQRGWVNTSPQMILALLRHLVNVVGVAQSDITVGDTTCYFPNHYWDYLHGEFPNVRYLQWTALWGRVGPVSSQGRPSETRIFWSTPAAAGFTPDYLPVNYAEANYLINFACLKGHSAGITLCGKNDYGSLIRTPSEAGYYNLHFSLPNAGWSPGMGRYRSLVDIMGHPKFGGKTILYLIDGLYAGYRWEGRPYPWQMAPFNNDWPSSLFASQDPVAIDSVGYDLLLAEWPHVVTEAGLEGGAEDYLHEAALANAPPSGTQYQPEGAGHVLTSSLGVHEHWNNPTDKQYSVNLGLGPGIELIYIKSPTAPLADFDFDGDTDLGDFGVFQYCFNGPNQAPAHANCAAVDLDYDSDVDLMDFSIFQRCFNGPNQAPACTR